MTAEDGILIPSSRRCHHSLPERYQANWERANLRFRLLVVLIVTSWVQSTLPKAEGKPVRRDGYLFLSVPQPRLSISS